MYNKSLLTLTTSNQKSVKMDIDDHQGLISYDLEFMKKFQRSRSDSLVFKKLAHTNSQIQRAPSVIISVPTKIIVEPKLEVANHQGFRIFRKIKKQRKKNQSDYRKNICGYITKKIIRQFISVVYYNKVKQLCLKHSCDYNDAKTYYVSKIEHVTGPSHIPGLLIPEDKSQYKFKGAFREFFQWFLKERYLRYLLIQGKMSDKKAYIEYKNNVLLFMVNLNNIPFPFKIQETQNMEIIKQVATEMHNRFPIVHIPKAQRL